MKLAPGDQILYKCSDRNVVLEIVDVRPTGYGWKYPDLDAVTPAGGENYFWSENSNDQFFDMGWRIASPSERVTLPTPTPST